MGHIVNCCRYKFGIWLLVSLDKYSGWAVINANRQSWTEPSIRRISSSRVGLVVGKKPNPWTTHPVADLALEGAGGWWTRFAHCADPVWPPTPECVVLQTLLQLTYMWNTNQFCPLRVFPVQRVWCRTESLWSSDSPSIACTAHPDTGSHDEVARRRPDLLAWSEFWLGAVLHSLDDYSRTVNCQTSVALYLNV